MSYTPEIFCMVAKVSRSRNARNSSGTGLAIVLVGALAAAGIFLAYQNVRMYAKRLELEKMLAGLEAQLTGLQDRRDEIEQARKERETEFYQERILREKGGYKKEGEEVVTILPGRTHDLSFEKKERVWWNPFTW